MRIEKNISNILKAASIMIPSCRSVVDSQIIVYRTFFICFWRRGFQVWSFCQSQKITRGFYDQHKAYVITDNWLRVKLTDFSMLIDDRPSIRNNCFLYSALWIQHGYFSNINGYVSEVISLLDLGQVYIKLRWRVAITHL